MLKRPSSRRRTKHAGIILNLVPILDTLVTLISFLLFTMSFIALVSVESPFPTASPKDVEEKLKEKPLQLTITLREEETQIWSPFDQIKAVNIKNLTPGEPDNTGIHAALLEIKNKFPKETKVVVVPTPETNYETLVMVMDAVRMMGPGDPPLYVKNDTTGNDELVKVLFPEIIFGNLLGDI